MPVNHLSRTMNFGLGENVVKEMTDDLSNKNHEVYFDNYFTSFPLMEYLKTNGVNAVGTVRTIRKALKHYLLG